MKYLPLVKQYLDSVSLRWFWLSVGNGSSWFTAGSSLTGTFSCSWLTSVLSVLGDWNTSLFPQFKYFCDVWNDFNHQIFLHCKNNSNNHVNVTMKDNDEIVLNILKYLPYCKFRIYCQANQTCCRNKWWRANKLYLHCCCSFELWAPWLQWELQ